MLNIITNSLIFNRFRVKALYKYKNDYWRIEDRTKYHSVGLDPGCISEPYSAKKNTKIVDKYRYFNMSHGHKLTSDDRSFYGPKSRWSLDTEENGITFDATAILQPPKYLSSNQPRQHETNNETPTFYCICVCTICV